MGYESAGSTGGENDAGVGQITVVAHFIGTSSRCSGTYVEVSGPNGYSDEEMTDGNGTVVLSNLQPGTHSPSGGGQATPGLTSAATDPDLVAAQAAR